MSNLVFQMPNNFLQPCGKGSFWLCLLNSFYVHVSGLLSSVCCVSQLFVSL